MSELLRGSHRDIELGGYALDLYHPPNKSTDIAARFLSAQPAGALPGAESIRLFEDWRAGMGFSNRTVQGGYERAERACTRYPNIVFGGPEVTEAFTSDAVLSVTGSFEISWRTGHTDLFFLAGSHALMVEDGHGPPAMQHYFGPGYVARTGVVGAIGPAIVGGTGGGIWQLATGWTQSSDAVFQDVTQTYWNQGGQIASGATAGQGGIGQFVLVGATASPVGFRYIPSHHLGATPMLDANWSQTSTTPVIVGNGAYSITRLVATKRKVWFIKTNGIHTAFGDGYTPNLTQYWEQDYDATWNGAAACIFGNYLYASHAWYLDRVPLDDRVQDAAQVCGPGEGEHPNESDIQGHVTAMCVVGKWLCAAKYNPDTNISYICYGRERTDGEDGYGPLIWHGSEIEVPGKVTHIQPTGIAPNSGTDIYPVLWLWATNGTTVSGYRAPIARGHPLKDTHYRFTPTWKLWTGKDDGGEQNSWTLKRPRRIDVYAEHVEGTTARVEVALAVDGGAYATQGKLGNAARASFGTQQPAGTKLSLQITGTGTSTNTPAVGATGLHQIMLPEQFKQLTLQISIDANDRAGQADLRKALAGLQTLGDVDLRWVDQQRYSVKVLPGIQEKPMPSPDGQGLVYVFNVPVDVIRRKWRWGPSVREFQWGAGDQWGRAS